MAGSGRNSPTMLFRKIASYSLTFGYRRLLRSLLNTVVHAPVFSPIR